MESTAYAQATSSRDGDPPEGAAPLPARVSAGEAVLRHKFAAVVPLILCLAVGVAAGLAREPVHTAEARLAIGGLDFSAPGALSAFASAGQALASTYARGINSEDVTREVSRSAGVPPREVLRQLTATALPETPVIRVIASSPSPVQSIRLANAGAVALVDFTKDLNGGTQSSGSRIFEQYQRASDGFQEAVARRDNALRDFKDDRSSANRRELVEARTEADVLSLRVQGLRANYLAATSGQVAVASVEPLAQAVSSSSDRQQKLQIYAVASLVVGGLLGVALAALLANRRARRAARP